MNCVRDEIDNKRPFQAKRRIQLNTRNEKVSSIFFLTSVNGRLESSGKEPFRPDQGFQILTEICLL